MPEPSQPLARNLIVGTAGHIDHGKTTLIHALTGTDTDRLAEEKRRGISIDLGFAHLNFPDNFVISFIDVPGHERFIKNMLAGVGGIHAVMLIVAADEGPKPQTYEHFEICRLLGITEGLVVLTKIDNATHVQQQEANRAIASLVRGSFLEANPVFPVSARTGQGMAQLTAALQQLAGRSQTLPSDRLARVPIDRVFAAKGFGTVVTGTLQGAPLRTGDAVRLHPNAQEARVRGLQVHGCTVDRARPGERTAVNLSGIDHSELGRGVVLTQRNELMPTSLFDANVEWLANTEIPTSREHFLLYAGTAEIPAQLKVVPTGPGEKSKARLWLSQPTLLLPGDRFILRRPSPPATVAGGVLLDPFPPARLNRIKILKRLRILEAASLAGRLHLLTSERLEGRGISDLVRVTVQPAAVIRAAIEHDSSLVLIRPIERVLTARWIEAARAKLVAWLREYHAQNPSQPGAPVAQARLDLEPEIAAVIFESPVLKIAGDAVALATHRSQSNPEQTKLLAQLEQAFRQAGFAPPLPADILKAAGLDPTKGRVFVEVLIKNQRLVRVSDNVIFHADVLAHIRTSLARHRGRQFSIPEFKEWTRISRKYAVPLLEYLDRQHVTRRQGDARVIL